MSASRAESRRARRLPRSRGLSLLEVLVAALVVVVGILPMISVFLSSGDSIRQTLPYYQAMFLSELSVEEARLGAGEDPHYLSRFIDESYCTTRTTVLRGNHPYLEVLEDTAAPWGRMEPQKDVGLTPAVGPLFQLAEPLGITVRPTFGKSPYDNLDETQIRAHFDWLDKRKKSMEFFLPTPVVSWYELARIESDKPAGSSGSGKRASFQRLLDLGARTTAVLDRLKVQVDQLKPLTTAGGTYSRALAYLKTAALQESAAAELVFILQEMEPPAKDLVAGTPPGSIGADDATKVKMLNLVKETLAGLMSSLAAAMNSSAQVSSLPSLPMGVYLTAHRRIVRCGKMDSLTRPWGDRSTLLAAAKDLVEFYRARMPNPSHDFLWEERRLPQLDSTYVLKAAVAKVMYIRRRYAELAMNVIVREKGS